MIPFPKKKYAIIYADPPWEYYGDPNKNAAAGKHYNMMSQDELAKLPVLDLAEPKAWLFCWATPARLPQACEIIERWGFYYRNVAYLWRKTKADGTPISVRRGIRPTYTKTSWFELLLVATTKKTGRMSKLHDESQSSEILAPKTAIHSEKPAIFRDLIAQQLGSDLPKIELFARHKVPGWDAWGNEVGFLSTSEEPTPPSGNF